jgi:hypothetical protein
MRKVIVALVALFLAPASALAQKLELGVALSPAVITFPSSDPDSVPLVSAPPLQITYRVRGNGNTPWSLTVLAAGDLISGASRVDISNVTWVATPAPPFQNGTLSKTVAQRVASGTGNVNPDSIGSITFRLANSWTYSTGSYSQTIVFTISVP